MLSVVALYIVYVRTCGPNISCNDNNSVMVSPFMEALRSSGRGLSVGRYGAWRSCGKITKTQTETKRRSGPQSETPASSAISGVDPAASPPARQPQDGTHTIAGGVPARPITSAPLRRQASFEGRHVLLAGGGLEQLGRSWYLRP